MIKDKLKNENTLLIFVICTFGLTNGAADSINELHYDPRVPLRQTGQDMGHLRATCREASDGRFPLIGKISGDIANKIAGYFVYWRNENGIDWTPSPLSPICKFLHH